MTFKDLGIDNKLVDILKGIGIVNPTPIQEETIELIRGKNDVIAEAETGTGKTLAFLLPIFQNIDEKSKNTQAIILTPTRELAIQIYERASILQEAKDINILAVFGGKDIGSQLKKLNRKPIHLIIATPGRLLDHLKRKTIDLSKIQTFVLDEADQMLFMGFKNEVEEIKKHCSKKHQMLCFSATMDSKVKKLAYRFMDNPSVVSVKKEMTLENIKQEVVHTTDRWKCDALKKVLEADNPFLAVIFCRTKRRADELEVKLSSAKFNCAKIHSDIPQNKRERIIKDFRNAKTQYLIATDVASRGLDINGVTHIYNYDIPETVETYIHRIGRTGRKGEEGYTCLFIDPKNERMLREIEETICMTISERIIE
ncbi:MAG: DEAD/DEAH box helicase [Clostridiaceae bacterium]|nr:DEAD/DEAH box helicase [Clostridiaceae bacterium]